MRLDGIDVLRGTAVVSVTLYHFFILLGLTNSEFYPYIRSFAYLGVPLFFVISGYLIYASVDRNIEKRGTREGIKNYFLHRIFRIVPAYYFNLLIVLLLSSFVIGSSYYYSSGFWELVASHLTFSSYFTHGRAGLNVNGAYWTLNIEMLWYVIAPLFLIYIRRIRYFILIIILSFFYIWLVVNGQFDTLLNLNNNTTTDYELKLFYLVTQLPGQISYFALGILVYKFRVNILLLSQLNNYMLATFILFFYTFSMGYFNHFPTILLKHIMVFVVSGLLFVLLYRVKIKGLSFLEWLGKISYSIYLWHMPILFVMKQGNILEHATLLESSLYFILLLLAISSMSYYFVEESGFSIRKKIEQYIADKKSKKIKDFI